jgi:hypothetical protein
MIDLFLSLISLSTLVLPILQPAAQTDSPEIVEITSPVPGEALQGIVPVIGTIQTTSFNDAALEFSYVEDDTGSWFEIARTRIQIVDGEIGTWDTSTLTDGNYTLRLSVILSSGEVITDTVMGLRVRNYSAIETNTPAPTDTPLPESGPTRMPTQTLIPTDFPPAPSPLPPNPAQITLPQVSRTVGRGLLVTLAAFAILGFLVLRTRFRR